MIRTINENLMMMVIETENQVKLTYELIADFNTDLIEQIIVKDDYIDNLKTQIENACFSTLHQTEVEITKREVDRIRASHIICVNLERIADFCVNIVKQTRYLTELAFIHRYEFDPFFEEIDSAMADIAKVLEKGDLYGALKICKSEFVLDQLYKETFDLVMEQMHYSKTVGNLITVIFILRYMERIGDSLLNIGEALIFAVIGDRIKIRQIEALQKTLEESGFDGSLQDIDFISLWGSRSGCHISRVEDKKPSGFKAQGIFKEGTIKKIKTERESIHQWEQIRPGMAPKIFGYYEKLNTASLLLEFLPGCTIDQLMLTESAELIKKVVQLLDETVGVIWQETKTPEPIQTDYMAQLRSRFDSVIRSHPRFNRDDQMIGELGIASTSELVDKCQAVEDRIKAPFSVFIHGDFNTNNIIYNVEKNDIHYIDLYRSRYADYVQDASVFLVSFFRMPVFERQMRNRLNEVIQHFYQMFQYFAEGNDDDTFELRMALALARSFFTSTRFELNRDFANEMALRANYLLEKVVNAPLDEPSQFRLPDQSLFY